MAEDEGAALAGTIDAASAATRSWDVVVVGAGPAGAVAAREAARAGLATLLVERQRFPRAKVCGGCLNHTAVEALRRAGLGERLDRLGGQILGQVRLHHRGRTSTITVPRGVAVSRRTLDRMLAAAAIESGARFLPETTAIILHDSSGVQGDSRSVGLRDRHSHTEMARARVVVAADGLGHQSLRGCGEFANWIHPTSRIGAGALAPPGFMVLDRGVITMAIGSSGYVGAVLVEGDAVNIAAALDPAFVKRWGSVGRSVAAVFEDAGLSAPPGLDALAWQGTLPLTQRTSQPVGRKIFVVGDAARYVEPFTGEGMAWAFATAAAVAPLVRLGAVDWNPALERRWLSTYRGVVGPQQSACSVLARVLRSPMLVRAGMSITRRWPGAARPIVARLGA
jgi:2-polyprenyl-6-methoxyphenol hydroxylase-like FAD-dependent oxidoreductase